MNKAQGPYTETVKPDKCNLLFRPVSESDAQRLTEIYNYYVVHSSYTFDYEERTEAVFLQMIREITATYPFLVCEKEGRVIGYAYAGRISDKAAYQWSAELTIYIDRNYCRQGLGHAFYCMLLHLLRLQNFHTLYACITHPNATSEQLQKRFGFESLGVWHHAGYKLGAWHDIIWMQKVLSDYPIPPKAVTPFSQLSREQVDKICQTFVCQTSNE